MKKRLIFPHTKVILLLVGLSSVWIPLKAQTPAVADTAIAWQLYRDVFPLLKQRKLKEALPDLYRACTIFEREKDIAGIIQCHYPMARYFDSTRETDSSVYHYTRIFDAYDVDITADRPVNQFAASCNMLGYFAGVLGQDEGMALCYQETALKIFETKGGPQGCFQAGRTHGFISTIYESRGEYDKQLYHLQLYLTYVRDSKGPVNRTTGMAYNNMGTHHLVMRDYPKAEEYFLQGLEAMGADPMQNRFEKGILLGNLSQSAIFKKEYRQALSYSLEALDHVLAVVGRLHRQSAYMFNHVGEAYYHLGKYDSAYVYFSEALKTTDSTRLAETERGLSELFSGCIEVVRGEVPRAEEHFERFEKNYGVTNHPFLKYSYLKLIQAQCLREQGYHERSLEAAQRVISLHSEDFSSASVFDNPDPQTSQLRIEALQGLREKGRTAWRFYKKNKDSKWLELSWKTMSCAALFLDSLRSSFQGKSRLSLMEDMRSVYEGGIQSALELWKLTGETKYKESTWLFSEQSRASSLLEAFRRSGARSLAHVPDSVIRKEQRLQDLIGMAQKKRESLFLDGGLDSTAFAKASDNLLHLMEREDSLTARLQSDFPDYFKLRYQPDYSSLNSCQQALKSEGQTLLEYFVGDSNMYVFRIDSLSAQVFDLANSDAIGDSLSRFLSLLRKPSHPRPLKKVSRFLAAALIHPIFPEGQFPAKLLLIPDGCLGLLPFAALDLAPNKMEESEYLLEHSAISYGWSGSLAGRSALNVRRASANFLGVAPHFSGEGGLVPLEFNQQEVSEAARLFEGITWLGKNACKSRFKRKSEKFQVLHLSSHARANDSLPALSGIYFSDSCLDQGGQVLSLAEVYALNLNADLTVLSACETGYGKWVSGEGVLSLARGFAWAGSRSVLTSLWQVNHSSTHMILQDFYTHIDQGLAIDEALRQAQIAYLKDINRASSELHPFYWAALVSMGDVQPLKGLGQNAGFGIWWLLFAVGLIGLGIWVLSRRGKKAREFG